MRKPRPRRIPGRGSEPAVALPAYSRVSNLAPFWAGAMYSVGTMVEVKVPARHGKDIKGIERETGLSRDTVRKYLHSHTEPQRRAPE